MSKIMKKTPHATFTLLAGSLLAAGSACAGEITTQPVSLTRGGTAEAPAVFDGKGMVIDLGTAVTDHAW